MNIFKTSLIGLFVILFFSCREGNEKRTKSGMKYIVYREVNGKKPKTGDWVTVNMVYKEENDSVLFDSRTYGKPLRFALQEPKFPGSFEEGLTYLGEGDSATFFVNADSLFEHVIAKEISGENTRRPKPGSLLKFDVSLVRVQPYQEAEMEIAMEESKQERAERNALESYLKEKQLVIERHPEGYYLDIRTQGKGKEIRQGDTVSVNFTGRFLNGAIFDSNTKTGKPYTFILDKGEVIDGWYLAFQRMHEGDQAMLIVPSSLGYGNEGLKRQNGLNYIIPPFSTLIFDIEVLSSRPLAKK